MGKKKKTTIGFKYYFTIHMGLCRGSIDELVEIRVADKTAFRGSMSSNSTIFINMPELFGGETKEGGIEGPLDLMLGGPDQGLNSRLTAFLSGIQTAYRAVTTIVFDGLVCALSPYPKPWSFRARAVMGGWDGEVWYPEKARIIYNETGELPEEPMRDDFPPNQTGLYEFVAALQAWESGVNTIMANKIVAMNPAHIIYKCCTNRDWGRGLSRARLDETSFRSAADRLYSESFGLCLKWSRQGPIGQFIQGVLDHIGGVMFADLTTGLIKLRLVRDDYVPEDVPLYTFATGLLSIDDDDSSVQSAATAEVIVNYRDVVRNVDAKVRVKNTGALRSAEGVQSQSRDYPGLPTAQLALRVAQRDLKAAAGFIKRYTLRFDRRGYKIEPGSVFAIMDLSRGIEFSVLRAGRVEDSTLGDGTITVGAVTDVFGLPAASYVQEQVSEHETPSDVPQPVTDQRLDEVTYRDLHMLLGVATVGTLDENMSYVRGLGVRPSGLALSFQMQSGFGEYIAREDEGEFTPAAVLDDPLTDSYEQVTVGFTVPIGLVDVTAGTAALIDDEIFRVEALDTDTNEVTLSRGCVDTIPTAHAPGARIWFYQLTGAVDETQYVLVLEDVVARLLTRSSTGLLAPSFAAPMSVTMTGRQGRPYPPANVLLNGDVRPAHCTLPLTIEWDGRNRVVQADTLVAYDEGTVAEEVGTTYQIQIERADTDEVLLEEAAHDPLISGRTYVADGFLVPGVTDYRLIICAVRDGLLSLPGFIHDFEIP